MNPYEVLGLAEDESDERTIKRAYAKLLKQHRPDQDPEGFTRVRQAYQRVMAWRDQGTAPLAALPVELLTEVTQVTAALSQQEPVAAPSASSSLAPPVLPVYVAPRPQDTTPELWSAAVTAVTQTFALPASPEHDQQRQAAVAELSLLRRQGLGSLTHWRALVLDVVSGRWEVVLDWFDDADCERLVEELSLETMHEAFKYLAKREAWAGLVRLVGCWLSAAEANRRLLQEDGAVVLRWMGWLPLLDVTAAMRLVALAEAGQVSRATVHQADRLLAAAPDAKLLTERLRWYAIGRIIGTQPRHFRDPRVDEIVALTWQLPVTHPLRALLMGPAALRPKYQALGSAGGGLNLGRILLGLPNILLFLSLFAIIGDALKPWMGGFAVLLCWALVIWWWRNAATVSTWLFGPLYQPPQLATGWAVTWFSYFGAGLLAIAIPGPEVLRWSLWLVATLVFMRAYAEIRAWLRTAIGDQGWRSLIPKWHAVPRSYVQERKLTDDERWGAGLGALLWVGVSVWGMMQVAPFTSSSLPVGIGLLWWSGPATLLFLAIRAWLVMWQRCEKRSPGAIVYWAAWTLAWQAVPVLILPWWWDTAKIGWMIEWQAPLAAAAWCVMGVLAAAWWLRLRPRIASH